MDPRLIVHVAAGSVALLALVIVLASKKGTSRHRLAGWWFAGAMTAVFVSGALISIARLFDDRPANDAGALFLLHVGVLTVAGVSTGLRASRTRERTTPSRDARDLAAPIVLLAGSAGMLVLGIRQWSPLFLIFAALGAARAADDLRFFLRAPADRRAWLVAHISGMGTAAIGAVTAFVVVNAQRFAPSIGSGGLPMLLVWTLPGVIGGALLTMAQLRHRAH